MEIPNIPSNEADRLEALLSYSILDTLPEKDYDDFTKLASSICQTPISLVSLIDSNRQWFKSSVGLDATETPRELAFCAHAINQPDEILIVRDSREDKRFFDNPLVVNDPHVIFYAGVPLVNPDGFSLGTLCVIDSQPKDLSAIQIQSLKTLAEQLINLFELRRANAQLKRQRELLNFKNRELEQFAYVVTHDIKAPLNNLLAISEMVKEKSLGKLDERALKGVEFIGNTTLRLKNLVEGIIHYYQSGHIKVEENQEIVLSEMLLEIVSLLDPDGEFEFVFPPDNLVVSTNKTALEQILLNLINNAIKYNDKEKGRIEIGLSTSEEQHSISVKDNGRGIEEENIRKIFAVFTNLGIKDRQHQMGSGIGLATVQRLVHELGGQIEVRSEFGKGTEFVFTLKK